ncbi:uncharacterized protein N7496_001486 [Penicillium cataractarum]|uniref:Extracellular membrane protein CFEM domain-containing protein n=1 Tax=Penicillium cataractarum TaxID=2100454 RepID=A0A9W9VW77_9EURO|nr:uncharacterized protein N7496_001486 [Penicillium cataractarum]KAJ5390418.1 hypothetical protein N7496_001486 [Penicillium cataractarum]
MRSFIAALFLASAAAVSAQDQGDFLSCANAALDGVDTSTLSGCTDLSSIDCFCANTDVLTKLSDAATTACKAAGVDFTKLASSICPDSTKGAVAPERHASKPMEPASGFGMMEHNKRAFRSPYEDTAAPRVVYVTETVTQCSCKSTPAPYDPMHISQIPVSVPVRSSMGAMVSASSPAPSNGAMMAASSSVIFGSQMSAATPTPSGASANRFNTFQGAAPKTNAVQGGIAALGVAAIMGLMIAL